MFKKALIAGAVLAAAFGAQAQSAPFSVIGSVTPNSCTITLAGGGVADYGTLTTAVVLGYAPLAPTGTGEQHLNMGTKDVAFTVACAAPTTLELAFTDDKAATKTSLSPGVRDVSRFGISNGAAGAAIGLYQLRMLNVTMDGVAVATFLHAPTGSTTWSNGAIPVSGLNGSYASPGRATGFSTVAAATAPAAASMIAGTLNFNAMLATSAVASNANLTLAGSGSITLQYL